MSHKILKNASKKAVVNSTKAKDFFAKRAENKMAKLETIIDAAMEGAEFLVKSGIEVGKSKRWFQRMVIEKSPEFAKHYLDVNERITALQVAAAEKSENLMKEMYLGTVEAVFGTLNQIVAKVDLTTVITKAMDLAAASHLHEETEVTARVGLDDARAKAVLIEAEGSAAESKARAAYYLEQKNTELLRQEEKKQEMAQSKAEHEATIRRILAEA